MIRTDQVDSEPVTAQPTAFRLLMRLGRALGAHFTILILLLVAFGALGACATDDVPPPDAADPDTCSIRATRTGALVTVEVLSAPVRGATLLVLQSSGATEVVVGQAQFSTPLVSVELTGVGVRDDLWVVVASDGPPRITCESVVAVNQ